MRTMVKVYQIYFNDESKARLEPDYIPYYNNPATIFLESEVMCKLIEDGKHKDCKWFGVVSHKLRKKVHGAKFWGPSIANRSKRQFSPSEFEKFVRVADADIGSFCTHPPHYVFSWAERYHKGICAATSMLIKKLKYKIWYDQKSLQVIYFNYFVARPHIYEDFVKTLLRPAIELMKHDPDVRTLVNVNSRYRFPIPKALTEQTGYTYWPMHPFISERLINLYLIKNYNKFRLVQW